MARPESSTISVLGGKLLKISAAVRLTLRYPEISSREVFSREMYSEAVMRRFLNPRNTGHLLGATHYGQVGIPGDGPYTQMWLRIAGELIEAATFETYACPAAVACACLTTELVSGHEKAVAQKLEPHDLDVLLGGLPEGKGHCAQRSVDTLRRALGATL